MSRLFPHTPYAEDQTLSRTILTTHVLHRAIPTGAAVGLAIYPVSLFARSAFRKYKAAPATTTASLTATQNISNAVAGTMANKPSSPSSSPSWPSSLSTTPPPTTTTTTTAALSRPTLLQTTGRSALITTLFLAIYLPLYHMRTAQEIEWQDRAWRLLENKSQVRVDEWSLAGMGLGVGAFIVGQRRSVPARPLATTNAAWTRAFVRGAGAAGLGSLAACAGYCVWTYGVRRQPAMEVEVAKMPVMEQIMEAPASVAAEIVAKPVALVPRAGQD